MRIREIHARNVAPIKQFDATELSDLVVIAGANGAGKTRLIEALIRHFTTLAPGEVAVTLEATTDAERTAWGKPRLDTGTTEDSHTLRHSLQQNQKRRNFQSSVVYFESSRAVSQVKTLAFSWEAPDPWEEMISWDVSLKGLSSRFPDTVHAIFRKLQSQRLAIAGRAVQLRRTGHKIMNLEFEDPMEAFKKAFRQLLGPKELDDPNLEKQVLTYTLDGESRDITTGLSSGEREVVNIAFDFILRQPSDCVVVFDEPELHLHPELTLRLISTLRGIGARNQFILKTHSPDVIASSLDDTVLFVAPPGEDATNQAVAVSANDETNVALRSLGHSVGVISLGRRIVLIEGENSSLDRKTYLDIAANSLLSLVLVPSAGKHTARSFHTVLSNVLHKTLWGVDFFMLCDRDAVPLGSNPSSLEQESKGRFRMLPRYHLENYFLDATVLSSVFRTMEPKDSWLCDPEQVRAKLLSIASDFVPYAVALVVAATYRERIGNLDIMPHGATGMSLSELRDALLEKRHAELERIQMASEPDAVAAEATTLHDSLVESIAADSAVWRRDIPGRPVFNTFCSSAHVAPGRLRTLYIRHAPESAAEPFAEILEILTSFSIA